MLSMIKSLIQEKTSFMEDANLILENTMPELDDSIILGESYNDMDYDALVEDGEDTSIDSGDDIGDVATEDDDSHEEPDGDEVPGGEPDGDEDDIMGQNLDNDSDDATRQPEPIDTGVDSDDDIMNQTLGDELPEPIGAQTGEPINDDNDILSMNIDIGSNTPTDILPIPPANAADAVPDDSNDIMSQRVDSGFGGDNMPSDHSAEENGEGADVPSDDSMSEPVESGQESDSMDDIGDVTTEAFGFNKNKSKSNNNTIEISGNNTSINVNMLLLSDNDNSNIKTSGADKSINDLAKLNNITIDINKDPVVTVRFDAQDNGVVDSRSPYDKSITDNPVKFLKNGDIVKYGFNHNCAYFPIKILTKNLNGNISTFKARFTTGRMGDYGKGDLIVTMHVTIDNKTINKLNSYLTESYDDPKMEALAKFLEKYNDSNDIFNDDYFEEKSHRKLKFDYSVVKDVKSGHSVLLIFDLKGAQVTSTAGDIWDEIGKMMSKDKDSYNDSINARHNTANKNISKYGNLMHTAPGLKLLAIRDMNDNKKLQSVTFKNDEDNFTIKVGDKSPEWLMLTTKVLDLSENGTLLDAAKFITGTADRNLRRGHKIDDMELTDDGANVRFKHPSKKDVKDNPDAYKKEDANDYYDNDPFMEDISLGGDDAGSKDTATADVPEATASAGDLSDDASASTDTTDASADASSTEEESPVTTAVKDKVAEADATDVVSTATSSSQQEIMNKLSNITKNLEDVKKSIMSSLQ